MDDKLFLVEHAYASWRAHGSPRRIMAAVSGGADSVALLLALKKLALQEPIALFAAHVNHGLRPDAGEDAAFVQTLCREWKIPCTVDCVSIEKPGESGAREKRYEALLARCRESRAEALALAHHRGDQAETMLLHLFRGSGGAGMGGMEEWAKREQNPGGIFLWRPFLDVDSGALRRTLQAENIPWREDSTNAGDDYLRNYLRHQVLPAVKNRIPRAEEAMERAARILRDERDYFEREAQKWLAQFACLEPPCRYLLAEPFHLLHPALGRYVLRRACPQALDHEKTEALLKMEPGDTLNLPENWHAYHTGKRLHFLPPDPEKIRMGQLEILPDQGKLGDGVRTQAFPRKALVGAELRYKKEGDWIHPLGAPGKKSLQDYWVDKKIDRPFRPYLPLLCRGEQVIWAIGVGPGEEARVTADNEETVLLKYNGFLPGEMPGNER